MFDFNFPTNPQEILEILIIPFLITLAITALVYLVDILLVQRLREKFGEYTLIWRHSRLLRPKDLLGIRAKKEYGFDSYYYERDHDRVIREKLERGENILVCGNPLAGKTRAVYAALKEAKKTHFVTVPNSEKMDRANYAVPRFMSFLPGAQRRRVLVIDDIDKFTGSERRKSIVGRFLAKKVVIVATCRSGPDYDRFSKDELSIVFGDPVEIPRLSKDDEETIKKDTGKEFPKRFDGNIGSLFMDIVGMRERYKALGDEETELLLSIRYLYELGVYRGKDVFPLPWIITAAKYKYEYKPRDYAVRQRFKALSAGNFIMIEKDSVRVEEAYLDLVIEAVQFSLSDFHGMTDALAGDPGALHLLGTRAVAIGDVVTDKALLMKAAIGAFHSALKTWTRRRDRYSYARVRNSLGIAYGMLSEVEKPRKNVELSIENFKEVLKVYTLREFPTYYVGIQNNLGNTYFLLSQQDDPAGNLKRAIDAYCTALEGYTLKEFPIEYARTQNNLGVSYDELAKHKDSRENLERAINAYREALKVRTLKGFPMDYAETQNNLGISYRGFSHLDDPAGNLKKAIDAYNEALRVHTFKVFPILYATTQNNLGNAFSDLAEITGQVGEVRRAIDAYNEALKVYTLKEFPIQYAAIQYNLGILYGNLARLDDTVANLRRAIDAYREALTVRTPESLPIDHAMTMENLGLAYANLAEHEEREENLRLAEETVEAALAIFRRQKMTLNIQKAELNLERIRVARGAAPRTKKGK